MPLTRELPSPRLSALDSWHLEVVCRCCGARTLRSVRLLAEIDAILCDTCWSWIELAPLKDRVRAKVESAAEVDRRMRDDPQWMAAPTAKPPRETIELWRRGDFDSDSNPPLSLSVSR